MNQSIEQLRLQQRDEYLASLLNSTDIKPQYSNEYMQSLLKPSILNHNIFNLKSNYLESNPHLNTLIGNYNQAKEMIGKFSNGSPGILCDPALYNKDLLSMQYPFLDMTHKFRIQNPVDFHPQKIATPINLTQNFSDYSGNKTAPHAKISEFLPNGESSRRTAIIKFLKEPEVEILDCDQEKKNVIASEDEEESGEEEEDEYEPEEIITENFKKKRVQPNRKMVSPNQNTSNNELDVILGLMDEVSSLVGYKDIDQSKIYTLFVRSDKDRKKFFVKLKRNLSYYKRSLKAGSK